MRRSSARSVERAALVEPASGMAAPRQQYAPGSPTARPRQQMQVLIEQGRALQTDPNYIATARPDFFTEQYREKVVKYINELAEDFGLLVQTGGIACNYFDRYISHELRKGVIGKRQMQVIASTCLLIAAKFFDRKLPPLSELVVVHNNTATSEQFSAQEGTILEALEWKLHVVLPHALIEPLRACLPGSPFDQAIDDRMMFFVDLSVYGYKLLRFSSAEILGGSLLAAWKFSNEHAAVDYYLLALADACATTEERLKCCTNELVRYYQVCFPDAAKSYEHTKGLVFRPVSPEAVPESDVEKPDPEAEDSLEENTQPPESREDSSPLTVIAPLAETAPKPAPHDDRNSPTEIFTADFGAGTAALACAPGAASGAGAKKRLDLKRPCDAPSATSSKTTATAAAATC